MAIRCASDDKSPVNCWELGDDFEGLRFEVLVRATRGDFMIYCNSGPHCFFFELGDALHRCWSYHRTGNIHIVIDHLRRRPEHLQPTAFNEHCVLT